MVSVGHRTAFNEHLFGEPEQDANTALTELDKGMIYHYFKMFHMLYIYALKLIDCNSIVSFQVWDQWGLENNVKLLFASQGYLKNTHSQSLLTLLCSNLQRFSEQGKN